MNRKERRASGKKNPPIPTSFDKPVTTIAADPADGHMCFQCGSQPADFVVIAENKGERFGFPVCKAHTVPVAKALDDKSPKVEPRGDITDCAADLETGLNSVGWPEDDPNYSMVAAVVNRGGCHIMPCPVCSDAGIYDHLLRVRKDGGNFSVEAVAA